MAISWLEGFLEAGLLELKIRLPDFGEFSPARPNHFISPHFAERSRSGEGCLQAGVDPDEHGLQSKRTAAEGGDGLKSKQSGRSWG